jgi:hypothetical protein
MDTSSSWLDQLLGAPSTIGTTIGDITGFFTALEKLGAALTNPQTYVRIFMVLFGLFLMFGAFKYA